METIFVFVDDLSSLLLSSGLTRLLNYFFFFYFFFIPLESLNGAYKNLHADRFSRIDESTCHWVIKLDVMIDRPTSIYLYVCKPMKINCRLSALYNTLSAELFRLISLVREIRDFPSLPPHVSHVPTTLWRLRTPNFLIIIDY